MKTVLVAVTSLAMLSSGCSIAFLEKPRVTPDNKVECDSTMKFPLIDGVVGVVGISTPFLLEYMRNHGTIDADSPPYFIYVPLWVAGVGGAISAIVGYKRVGRCSDLKDSVAATANVPAQPPAPAQDAPAPAPAQ
jgi:hypothetical protein